MTAIHEHVARRIFQQAIAEQRASQLLEALFDGASVTIDPITQKLLIMDPGGLMQTAPLEQRIECHCEQGHVQRIAMESYSREHAETLASLMDGTSDLYRTKPRDVPIPGSTLGKCGICHTWITCTIYGYEETS